MSLEILTSHAPGSPIEQRLASWSNVGATYTVVWPYPKEESLQRMRSYWHFAPDAVLHPVGSECRPEDLPKAERLVLLGMTSDALRTFVERGGLASTRRLSIQESPMLGVADLAALLACPHLVEVDVRGLGVPGGALALLTRPEVWPQLEAFRCHAVIDATEAQVVSLMRARPQTFFSLAMP